MSVKCDIILCGVGGQGVLSLAGIIAASAMKDGLHVKQSEVHGMAQRGGAVMSHLRISSEEIESDLIGKGFADIILSMEPLESLRYLPYLRTGGTLITATTPVVNIDNYPDIEGLLEKIGTVPNAILVDAEHIAKKCGSPRTANMVLVGAASPLLPVAFETIDHFIDEAFGRKGPVMVRANKDALRAGRELGQMA